MPRPQQILDIERVVKSIDAPAAVVILVGDDNEIETAAKGIDNDEALFTVVWGVAVQLAAALFEDMPQAEQRSAKLYLPTAEQARQLGILDTRANGRRS